MTSLPLPSRYRYWYWYWGIADAVSIGTENSIFQVESVKSS